MGGGWGATCFNFPLPFFEQFKMIGRIVKTEIFIMIQLYPTRDSRLRPGFDSRPGPLV
jgi:hypothetical protein